MNFMGFGESLLSHYSKHKLNLHAMYLDTDEEVDLNQIEPKHFTKWVEWAKNKVLA